MSLGFGLLSAQLRPGETSWERAYRDTVEIAEPAERFGYASIWTSEHHFVDDGYMPSLMVVGAALTQATETISLGTGVLLAPLHDPIRLAEDAATVQLLSGNRLLLGLGLGWADYEFDAFGVDITKRGRIMDEILEFLPKAWSGEVFDHDGAFYQFPKLAVRPVPDNKIPVVIGGTAEPAIRSAARLADGIISNASVDGFLRQVEWAKEELEARDRSIQDFRWIHYSVLHPSDAADGGWDEMRPHAWHMAWKYGDMRRSSTRPGLPPVAPEFGTDREEAIRTSEVIMGPSVSIVEQLQALKAAWGVPVEFVARSCYVTMGRSQQLEIMQRLAEEVLPHV